MIFIMTNMLITSNNQLESMAFSQFSFSPSGYPNLPSHYHTQKGGFERRESNPSRKAEALTGWPPLILPLNYARIGESVARTTLITRAFPIFPPIPQPTGFGAHKTPAALFIYSISPAAASGETR